MLHVPRSNLRLRGELLTCDDLPRILPAWKMLCDNSVEDNVYYSPRYSQALLDNVEEKNIAFAAVWTEARLVALLPFSSSHVALPGLSAAGRAWQNKFIFSCMPLLDAVRKIEAAGVLLDVLASVSEGEWIVPTVNTKGEACRALVAALSARRMPWAVSQPFQRAILENGPTFEEHMQRHVAASRRKGLLRNQRRLQQLGKLDHEAHCFGPQLDRTLAAYLEIEASGWKGRRGTALACHEGTRKFALAAFSGEKGNSNCRADVLTLDGVPIAVSLIAIAGRTGFTIKSCYDEAYRSYSAGLLLELEVIRSFLSGNWASRLDSGTSGAHVLDSLWPGRSEVADLIFSLSPRHAQLRLSALYSSEKVTKNIKTGVKRWLTRVKK